MVAVGMICTVRVSVVSVDDAAGTASVQRVDNNDTPFGAAITCQQGLLTAVSSTVAVGDVLECLKDEGEYRLGWELVVRHVDPANATKWSPSASGAPLITSAGWRKVGVVT